MTAGRTYRERLVDDWAFMTPIVPNLKEEVLRLIKDLTGKTLEMCSGDCQHPGYREGTEWLHLYGITKDVHEHVLNLVHNMSLPYQKDINLLKARVKAERGHNNTHPD